MQNKKPLSMILISGVFLFLDRWLKWQALHSWSPPMLLNRFFGWDPFLNAGVAFSIPVPTWLVVILTVPVIIWLLYKIWKLTAQGEEAGSWKLTAYVFVLTGAVSNLIDRLVYHNTIDYIRIFTGVINVADVLIVVGFVLYLYTVKHENTKI